MDYSKFNQMNSREKIRYEATYRAKVQAIQRAKLFIYEHIHPEEVDDSYVEELKMIAEYKGNRKDWIFMTLNPPMDKEEEFKELWRKVLDKKWMPRDVDWAYERAPLTMRLHIHCVFHSGKRRSQILNEVSNTMKSIMDRSKIDVKCCYRKDAKGKVHKYIHKAQPMIAPRQLVFEEDISFC